MPFERYRLVAPLRDGDESADKPPLATGMTDANGAVAFESTDAAWGKTRGLKLAVSASETHRAGTAVVHSHHTTQ